MIKATELLSCLCDADIDFVSGTPCSYLKPLINAVAEDERFVFVDAVNEGDAVAMAVGAVAGGKRAAVMFQNSGLGNAVNALTSLCNPFEVPVLLIITHRGEPGGAPDEPQHKQMGKITPLLLETMGLPWVYLPTEPEAMKLTVASLIQKMDTSSSPVALIVSKGTVAPHELVQRAEKTPIGERRIDFTETLNRPNQARVTRTEALQLIQSNRQQTEVLVATTGYTGRELYALGDEPWQLYTVGSMGSSSAIGLGLSIAQPERPVTVIDGDGALLMRLGNMAMVGAEAGDGFTHILLDNEVHDSTGGQGTVSRGVAFGAIAQACGYKNVVSTDEPEVFASALGVRGEGSLFIHLRTSAGVPAGLPRPEITPGEGFRRLQNWLSA